MFFSDVDASTDEQFAVTNESEGTGIVLYARPAGRAVLMTVNTAGVAMVVRTSREDNVKLADWLLHHAAKE